MVSSASNHDVAALTAPSLPALTHKEFLAQRPLLSRKELAQYLGMSERATYTVTSAAWFCTPVVISPRLLKWRREEVDAALASAPRRPVQAEEPAQLRRARVKRDGVLA